MMLTTETEERDADDIFDKHHAVDISTKLPRVLSGL